MALLPEKSKERGPKSKDEMRAKEEIIVFDLVNDKNVEDGGLGGYEVNNGYCYTHRVQGKELGELRQCSFFDKKGFCMIATAEKFKDRFYCSSHHKLLIEYDKEIKEQIKILNEEERKGKMIELVRVLESYITLLELN
ncbi:24946_t:CDS:2, partial [Racocetra persica]